MQASQVLVVVFNFGLLGGHVVTHVIPSIYDLSSGHMRTHPPFEYGTRGGQASQVLELVLVLRFGLSVGHESTHVLFSIIGLSFGHYKTHVIPSYF